jgi:hypothetical protein
MPEQMKMAKGRVAAIVDNPKLARMTDTAPRPRAIAGKVLRMAAQPKPDTGKTKRMAAVPKATRIALPRKLAEMQPPKTPRKATTNGPGGYVRLRVRVTDGVASVVGAKAVEGPLVETKLQGEVAYEVTVGKKRVAAGAIPDMGEQRSFPAPDGPPEMRGHHITPLRTYEVNVRVPKEAVSTTALPRLEIALYRMKEPVPLERLGPAPLREQFGRELREVARVKGIKPDALPAKVATEVRRAFG